MGIADKLSVPDEWHRRRLRARRERPRHGSAAEERDELPPLHSIARRRGRAACGSRPLLCGGLRRRLPRDEFPAVRRFCPGVEEHEFQAARLAVDLSLDRRAAGDQRLSSRARISLSLLIARPPLQFHHALRACCAFMCGWPPLGKRSLGVQRRGRLQSCVRPVGAVRVDCWP